MLCHKIQAYEFMNKNEGKGVELSVHDNVI